MRLVARTRYASRILLELARFPDDTPTSAARLSELTSVPVPFVEQILKPLKRHGLTASTRGASGGHVLALPAEEITLGMVVQLMEGGVMLAPCCGRKPLDCPRKSVCLIRETWQNLSLRTERELEAITLKSLLLWDIGMGSLCPGTSGELSCPGSGCAPRPSNGARARGRSIFPYFQVLAKNGWRQGKNKSRPAREDA